MNADNWKHLRHNHHIFFTQKTIIILPKKNVHSLRLPVCFVLWLFFLAYYVCYRDSSAFFWRIYIVKWKKVKGEGERENSFFLRKWNEQKKNDIFNVIKKREKREEEKENLKHTYNVLIELIDWIHYSINFFFEMMMANDVGDFFERIFKQQQQQICSILTFDMLGRKKRFSWKWIKIDMMMMMIMT